MKIQQYEFSRLLQKDTDFLDFASQVSQAINTGTTTIVATIALTGQTGDISATTIYTPSTAWYFRVGVYMICTTAGTGTLSSIIRWTDNAGSKSLSPAANVDLSSTSNGSTGNDFIRANGSAITYETAIAGKAGSPVYEIYIVLEQLG